MKNHTPNATVEQVCAILTPLFSEPVGPDASTITLKEWDSLKYLEIVGALEDQLAVEFTAQELLRLSSVREIVTVLHSKDHAE
ncbi:acyl carrier protein [Pseudodesulfovibrio sp. JC047]|uniref:acyl carrier protein n=1 Tax=Pseudodesulfovibrio sp. JC047 TaxID=2683199 RepID=UPI0013CF5113|nr:acyl carrier protein [Pseudodesulfovibrio sp. JC047]NDV20634.1 acyl carrier protein [Pseudodesulfovibrio sp. JC047]